MSFCVFCLLGNESKTLKNVLLKCLYFYLNLSFRTSTCIWLNLIYMQEFSYWYLEYLVPYLLSTVNGDLKLSLCSSFHISLLPSCLRNLNPFNIVLFGRNHIDRYLVRGICKVFIYCILTQLLYPYLKNFPLLFLLSVASKS